MKKKKSPLHLKVDTNQGALSCIYIGEGEEKEGPCKGSGIGTARGFQTGGQAVLQPGLPAFSGKGLSNLKLCTSPNC